MTRADRHFWINRLAYVRRAYQTAHNPFVGFSEAQARAFWLKKARGIVASLKKEREPLQIMRRALARREIERQNAQIALGIAASAARAARAA